MDNEQTASYAIKLDIFEGPLDLLLYLIKKNEIDIYNIPIALITEQYLDYLKMIKALNLDLAGEYLVMASTLIHIKSKMLLPAPEELEEEEEDPRAELVRQLVEHKTFKELAAKLADRPLLERDVFTRISALPEETQPLPDAEEGELVEVSVFELIEAFHRIISQLDKKQLIEIDLEKLSLTDVINEIMDRLAAANSLTFDDLLQERRDRRRIVYTFLAVLELIRLRMIKAYQTSMFGTIRIFPAVEN
ncbi:MAG TPA: segregation/condensation protein A [Smithella sp.]|nr:segregation/condensation protein A [Smithella sp.]HRS97758.1 segregation/condensation protein A [Smithella sp.]